MRIACFFALFLCGCPESSTRGDGGREPDAGDRDTDAGADAYVPPPIDGGPDAGPAELALGVALHCDIDPDDVVRLAARHTACRAPEHTTIVAVVEAWEVGLLSQLDQSGGVIEGMEADIGCPAWRCAADAESCDAYEACLDAAAIPGACEPYSLRCDGTNVVRCAEDGTASHVILECASFGASCDEGSCRIGECSFGPNYYNLGCDEGDLVLCEGLVRMSCEAWEPGTTCRSFAIGGEVPTQWCAPEGFGGAGLYSLPVDECEAGVISFETASGESYTFDCIDAGYAGCDERGCTL
jgi:hypothetical protein